MSAHESYLSSLNKVKDNNLYRCLVESDALGDVCVKRGGREFVSFCCNDYFGFSGEKSVKDAAIKAIEDYGVGGRASRYVTGNNSLYSELESQLALMKNCDEAIVFASGYAAAIGVIPALVGKGDLIVADKLIHSSLIDGSKLSGAKLLRFTHNDVAHCREILEQSRGQYDKCVIITETVFSMDGDVGQVDALLELSQEFDCIVISDDAHGLWPKYKSEEGTTTPFLHRGFLNPSSVILAKAGIHRESDDKHQGWLQMGTLSKSVGCLGGYVAGDSVIIDYLRNFAKSAIYSTALPPSVLASALQSLKIIQKENPGKQALENAQYFCELMKLPKAQSAIIPIIIGDNVEALRIAKELEEKGILISAIRPPTVPQGTARLRITFSSLHQKDQIKALAQILNDKIKRD